jgi:hypothetical protein
VVDVVDAPYDHAPSCRDSGELDPWIPLERGRDLHRLRGRGDPGAATPRGRLAPRDVSHATFDFKYLKFLPWMK